VRSPNGAARRALIVPIARATRRDGRPAQVAGLGSANSRRAAQIRGESHREKPAIRGPRAALLEHPLQN